MSPALASSVTVPAVPPKTAKPGCGDMGAVTLPVASVKFTEVSDHVPSPPPIVVAEARPSAFQKERVVPCVLKASGR